MIMYLSPIGIVKHGLLTLFDMKINEKRIFVRGWCYLWDVCV